MATSPSAEQPKVDVKPRCSVCNRILAYAATRPWIIQCSKCGTINSGR